MLMIATLLWGFLVKARHAFIGPFRVKEGKKLNDRNAFMNSSEEEPDNRGGETVM